MKKSVSVILLCLLCVSVWAVPPEKQIERLIFNTMEGNHSNKNIVANDFDSIIIKSLENTCPAEWENLTEKLFLYELKQFIAPAGKVPVYTVTIYPLSKGVVIHKRKNKIKSVQINDSYADSSARTFLVMVSIGKDYPEERILFISMRKYKNFFVIEPYACVFGSDSFFHFSGFSYDQKTKTINWEENKKTAFVRYLKEGKIRE